MPATVDRGLSLEVNIGELPALREVAIREFRLADSDAKALREGIPQARRRLPLSRNRR